MARYIDADALTAHEFKNDISYKAFCNLVKRQPAADVAPVRHGRWIESDTDGFVCSECRNGYRDQPTLMGKPMFEWCPVCGAKMDGGTIGDPMEDDLK